MGAADNHASALLDPLDDLLTEQYFALGEDQVDRHGRTFNRLFSQLNNGEFEVDSDGLNITTIHRNADNIRGAYSPLSDFRSPKSFEATRMKIRWSDDPSAGANDFRRLDGSAKISDIEMVRSTKSGSVESGVLVKIADRVYREIVEDYNEKLAKLRNCPSDGRLAIVSGTPVQDDATSVTGGTPTADNTDGARFYVDNGSIAMFAPGMWLDIYDPTNTEYSAQAVQVSSVNYDEKSVGVRFVTGASSGDLANVADNDTIYLSGMKGYGVISLESWFTQPGANDDFFGQDRLHPNFRWMQPQFVREGLGNEVISRKHLNAGAQALGYYADTMHDVAIRGDVELMDALRDQLDETLVVMGSTKGDGERTVDIGATGLYYQHPTIGRVELASDPLAMPNKLRFITKGTWRGAHYNQRGLRRVPGTKGNWYRVGADTLGAGDSMFWQTDAYAFHCDVCLMPQKNLEIQNITSS